MGRTWPGAIVGHAKHLDLLTPSPLADLWGVTPAHLANLRHQPEGICYLKSGSRVA